MPDLTLKDGRTLVYHLHGSEQGAPVLFVHGISDSGLIRHHDDALTALLGVRLISPNLPGVGRSTRNRGRGLFEWSRDAIELADALGLERFAVAGHSGGAAHALALAAACPRRVTRVVLASPVGPFDDLALDAFVVSSELRTIQRLYRWRLFPVIRAALVILSFQVRRDPAGFIEESALSYPSDTAAFLESPTQRKIFEASFSEGFAQYGEGIYEVVCASSGKWDFDLSSVTQPVDIFYGDTDDIMSPELSFILAKRLPNATTHLWAGGGHYDYVKRERWVEFVGAMVGASASASV